MLESTFADDLGELVVDWSADQWPDATTLIWNDQLADRLGIETEPVPARTVAMAYAGHQFGGYSPRLGDGRALLLGEMVTADGQRLDVHLKGSGRTPFARGGDGKAAVGPMLREYLISEAMHALGIPTTRALEVRSTGEPIVRDGRLLPGAVLTRVASSHIRVGTFEYAARLPDRTVLPRLVRYAIDRHHPHAAEAERPALALLDAVAAAQASLVAKWMLVGFVHGVMNTDNMTISGETIDYGPCAYMDRYDPATVFSSIDHAGRYAYGNQPRIAQWNLTRLAETLLPEIDPDSDRAVELATDVLTGFPGRLRASWSDAMRAKLGLVSVTEGDEQLFDDLLEHLHRERLDYTGSFRSLADHLRGAEPMVGSPWSQRWLARLDDEGRDRAAVADGMDRVNPRLIPRNHLVDAVLAAATDGDLQPFHELLGAVSQPYDKRAEWQRFAEPAPDRFAAGYQTFCGT